MIGFLRGNVLRKTFPTILIDVHGVGYEVRVPLTTLERLPGDGHEAQLETVTLFRNESLELFGFASQEEKELFLVLVGVSGVGPKTALSLLSALPAGEIIGAVSQERTAILEKVPGIGKKTAQRLVLELKDKVKKLVLAAAATTPSPPPAADALREDALEALQNLGYRRVEAERALDLHLREIPKPITLACLLRSTLKTLGGHR